VEVTAIKMVTGREATEIIGHLLPYNLLASGTALLAFWAMSFWYESKPAPASSGNSVSPEGKEDVMDIPAAPPPAPGSIAATMSTALVGSIERVNVLKAMVPIVPIFLLLAVKPLLEHLNLLPPALIQSAKNDIGEQSAIAAAMLVGVVCAGLISMSQAARIPVTFFEGAGFAFAHVISVIAAARMFAQGIQVNGLIDRMTPHLQNAPIAITAASVVIPWVMACVTGTAVGTAPLVINIILPIAMGAGGANLKSAAAQATGFRIGSVNAIAAQFGRTSSPVAPVTIMCATLARARPIDLVWRVTPPMIVGAIVLFFAALWSA
jgi:DcuC family C4-dicarboxylate transporter